MSEENISWYHGKIARSTAEEVLAKAGDLEGHFLVRDSSTALGDYVLSLIHDGEPIHYQIRRHGEDAFFSIDEGPIIHGLEMLVEYYRHQPNGLSTQLGRMCKGSPPPAHCRIHGRTNLLHRATREGNLKVVSELLKSGYKSIDAKNLDGQTAVHVASILGHDDILQCLLEAGANVGIRDSKGLTALHYACQLNHSTSTRILINLGNANFQARSSQGGWVAMHEAASRGYIECIKVLLAFNAPCRPRTDDGATPYDISSRNGHYECARLLEDYEAPPAKTNLSSWFHGNLSRQDAFDLLKEQELVDGLFLVRCSSSKAGVFVLTMVHNKYIYNFEIQHTGKFYFIDDGPYLESLEHVIAHYTRLADGLPTNLKMPVIPDSSKLQSTLSFVNPCCKDENIYDSGNIEMTPETDINENDTSSNSHRVEYIRQDSLKLGETIGEGEFGSVLQGIWHDAEGKMNDVAVKMLRNEHVQMVRDSFLREASVMIDLNHPCIVKLIGICLGPPLMMIQELVRFGSMLDYLLDYPDHIDSSIHLTLWASQIAHGMMYLEEKRFVHRDLAARNILLDSLKQAKISDFGLSRSLGLGSEYYKASQGGRWPVKWYAPESINYGTFSHASDVWSFGITLWEMYSLGKTPYGELTGAQVIQLLEQNRRLSIPDTCNEQIYSIMQQCWAYNPEDRPTFVELYRLFSSLDNSEQLSDSEKSVILSEYSFEGTEV